MGIEVDVYTPANVFVATLTAAFDRGWRHELRGAGSGMVSILRDDAQRSICARKRLLKFKLDGTIRFASVIGPRPQNTIDAGEEAAETMKLGGAGVNTLLANAPIIPELGIGRSAGTRWFNGASHDYDASTWDPAVELYRQDDDANGYGPLYPEGFPDSTAWWIWCRAGAFADPPMPVGVAPFRYEWDETDEHDMAFFIAADDGWRFWLDGDLVEERVEAFAWQRYTRVDRFLTPGHHVIYIEAENIDRPLTSVTNFAGLIFAGYRTFFGVPNDLVMHSDDTWVCQDYPAEMPTMTPGEIAIAALGEAHFIGAIAEITQGAFTATLDENGDPWDTSVNISIQVGATFLDLLMMLAETAIDFEVDPATLQLRIYNKGSLGGATAVSLDQGTHLLALDHPDEDDPPTDLLVKLADGTYTYVLGGNPGQPVFRYLEAGTASSVGQAERAADAVFARSPSQVSGSTLDITGDRPYVDWRPGSTISTPDIDGAAADTLVMAIVVADRPPDGNGYVDGDPLFAFEGYQ